MVHTVASILWLFVCLCLPSARSNFVGDSYLSIEQPLDHACTGDSCATFSQQLVLINDTGYQPGGPAVLFLGGAASMYNFQTRLSFFVHNSHVLESAFVLLEHRFYGDSRPAETDAFSADNLAFLTVDQVLADVHHAIDHLSHKHFPADTVWILAGEAYSASLAAWYSQAYPLGGDNPVYGTVASSPALEATADFSAYFPHFENAIAELYGIDPATQNAACVSTIKSGTRRVEDLLQSGDAGREAVANYFGACESTISPSNEFFFKWVVSEVIASSMVLNTAPDWSVNQTCNAALDTLGQGANASMFALQRAFQWNMDYEHPLCLEECEGVTDLARVADVLFRPAVSTNADGDCVSFDEQLWLVSMQSPSNAQRAWWWQRCNELGWFHSTDADSMFFPNLDSADVVAYCSTIFDTPSKVPDTTSFNNAYGGLSGLSATRSSNSTLPPIWIANANMDPLKTLAPAVSNTAAGYEVVNYVGGQNGLGYQIFASDADPASLVSARNAALTYMQDAVAVGQQSASDYSDDTKDGFFSSVVAMILVASGMIVAAIIGVSVAAATANARQKRRQSIDQHKVQTVHLDQSDQGDQVNQVTGNDEEDEEDETV